MRNPNSARRNQSPGNTRPTPSSSLKPIRGCLTSDVKQMATPRDADRCLKTAFREAGQLLFVAR